MESIQRGLALSITGQGCVQPYPVVKSTVGYSPDSWHSVNNCILIAPRSVYFLRQTPGGRALIDKWYDIRKHEQAQNAHDQDGLYHYLSRNNEVRLCAPCTCILFPVPAAWHGEACAPYCT